MVGIELDDLFVGVEWQGGDARGGGVEGTVVVGVGDAEPLVEAAARGEKLRMMAEVPLAENRSRVTAVFEDLREEFFLGVKTGGARVVEGATHADAVGVATRHECGARGGADGLGHVETGEARALSGEAIDVRRLDILGSVAAEVAVAEVIGEDENNVWWRRGGRGGEQCGGRSDGREDEQNAELAGETAERKGGLHGPNVESGAAEASVEWGQKAVRSLSSGL